MAASDDELHIVHFLAFAEDGNDTKAGKKERRVRMLITIRVPQLIVLVKRTLSASP